MWLPKSINGILSFPLSICSFYLKEIRAQSNHLADLPFLIIQCTAAGVNVADDIKEEAVAASNAIELPGMAMIQTHGSLRKRR